MSLTDPIADMLTSIRNAIKANKESVEVPGSKLSLHMLEVLKKEGYIDNFKFIEDTKQGKVKIYLRYDKNEKPAITGLKRISRPGLRVYAKRKEIPYVLNGLGIALLSSSSGIVSDKEARQKKVGGEVLCYVW